MSPALPATPTQPATALRHRRDARRLTAGQLTDFRRAVSQAQKISDDRGYAYYAGIHGLPLPIYCTHNSPLFLAWHRAYLYFFEKALQDQVPGVTLPWWNWTSHQGDGLPVIYSQKRPQNRVNPLYDAAIPPAGRREPGETRTWRDPGPAGELPSADSVEQVLANTDFITFQTQLESLHGAVHMWVGGTMGDIAVAAYDPVFWAHHCMIDRLWYLWQLRHPGTDPPTNLLSRALPPFAMTVQDTLSSTSLGYDYAASTTAAPGPGPHA
jgi:tyrosinase